MHFWQARRARDSLVEARASAARSPDSAHVFLFQYPVEVAAEVNGFIDQGSG